MRILSAQELLEIWEHAQHLHAIDKALTLLVAAFPQRDTKELAMLTIGERDALLFAVRNLVFGPKLEAFCECPSCGMHLEFSLDTADLLSRAENHVNSELHLKAEGFDIYFRLPNSFDLAEIIGLNAIEGYKKLLEQCILRVSRENAEIGPEALPETVTSLLASRMIECDPLFETQLSLECPSCTQQWSMMLDIVSFFWTELDAEARNLLRQVHLLARFYGWRESDILSLGESRRRHYIEMVTS